MEKHVLRFIAEDRTTRAIADEMNISPQTVDNHRMHICGKLRITGAFALIKFAVKYKALLE